MSDPQPHHLESEPRRAEPLQPDNPGHGTEVTPADDDNAADVERETARKAKKQSDAALDNVRRGYGT